MVDGVLLDGVKKTLTTLSVGMIFLSVFKVILSAFRSILLLQLSQKLDVDLLFGYYSQLLKLLMNFLGSRKVGEIISRFNDAGQKYY